MKQPRNFHDFEPDARISWHLTVALLAAEASLEAGDIEAAWCHCSRSIYNSALGWPEFVSRIFKGTSETDRRFAKPQIRVEVSDDYPDTLWSINYSKVPAP